MLLYKTGGSRTRLKDKINGLSQILHGRSAFPSHILPSKYTGELFGVQYLYDQAGLCLYSSEENLDREIDEGFENAEDELMAASMPTFDDDPEYLSIYHPDESEDDDEEEVYKIQFDGGGTMAAISVGTLFSGRALFPASFKMRKSKCNKTLLISGSWRAPRRIFLRLFLSFPSSPFDGEDCPIAFALGVTRSSPKFGTT